jgi:predicted flap endonuclease-1-like 5' DNA nuclease
MKPRPGQWCSATAPGAAGPEAGGLGLPLSKLRGLTLPVRAALKRRGIVTCGRLLRAAGGAQDRARLAREAGIDPEVLLALVRRADLARVGGIGTVFGLMLEELGVHDVAALAARDPAELHARLSAYNREERLARRSPTPEEVRDWVAQARSLPPLVSY